ncbi:MAG: ribonuclease III domain-containing protein [Promethearchaeota archaeon]
MSDFKKIFNQFYPNQWRDFTLASEKLQNIINYQFSNVDNLYSVLSIRGSKLPTENFERLEFLGDSLLKAIQGILLYEKSNEFAPKQLTQLRSNLENNRTFAKIGKELPFTKVSMILGIGQLSEGQAADCFEALIGAIYIDNGKNFNDLIRIVQRITHFENNYKQILGSRWGGKDPKSILHEWAQKQYGNDFIIEYPSENRGTGNAPEFHVRAIIKRKISGKIERESNYIGPSNKKKEGEKKAAKALLDILKEEGKLE